MPSVTRIVKFIRKGEPGRSVLVVDVEYAQGDSNVKAPTEGWDTNPPVWIVDKYIWSRTRIEYSDGDPEYTNPVCITGSSVVKIEEEYYRSTNSTALYGGEWSTKRPKWINGYYIWTRSHVFLTDGDFYTNPVCVTGSKGSNGNTYYTWIKYADSLDSTGYPATMYDTPTADTKYIGIAYNQSTSDESNDSTLYTWTKIRGEDGVDGVDGTSFTAKGSAVSHFASPEDYNNPHTIKIIGKIYLVDDPTAEEGDYGALAWIY